MSYKIIFDKAIRHQIQRLPGKAVAKQQIALLSDNPRPPKSKELAGHPNYYRM
jgi:mRNA-degrading endonuclease RelE of RelBE toxin-antitoxin system